MADFESHPPPPTTEADQKATAAATKAQTKLRKRVHRFLRSTFAVIVASLPIISFGLTATALASGTWAYKYTNADNTQWYDISPSNGNCSCATTQTNYCAETSDAFQGTAYLSVTVLFSELIIALIYAFELGQYGLFGGSHTFTRVQLIVALLALSTIILSVISWMSTYSNNHCGDPSFQQNGASLGAPFFVRCIEIAGMLGFVLYITSMFPKTNRGPPSIPLVASVLTLLVTSITTFLQGWMDSGGISYTPWTACTCGAACSGMAGTLAMSTAGSALALVTGFITVFFTSLRAVDNEGATLKISTGTGIATAIFQLLSVIGFTLSFGSGCGTALDADGYVQWWPYWFTVSALVCQGLFVILNIIYMLRACCDPEVPAGMTLEEAQSALTSRPAFEQTIYYRYWWDHLKDPRTLAHEAREEDEDDNAISDSDEDADAADVLDGAPEGKETAIVPDAKNSP